MGGDQTSHLSSPCCFAHSRGRRTRKEEAIRLSSSHVRACISLLSSRRLFPFFTIRFVEGPWFRCFCFRERARPGERANSLFNIRRREEERRNTDGRTNKSCSSRVHCIILAFMFAPSFLRSFVFTQAFVLDLWFKLKQIFCQHAISTVRRNRFARGWRWMFLCHLAQVAVEVVARMMTRITKRIDPCSSELRHRERSPIGNGSKTKYERQPRRDLCFEPSLVLLGWTLERFHSFEWWSERLVSDFSLCRKRSHRCSVSASLGTLPGPFDHQRTLDRRRRQESDWARERLRRTAMEFNCQRTERSRGKAMPRTVRIDRDEFFRYECSFLDGTIISIQQSTRIRGRTMRIFSYSSCINTSVINGQRSPDTSMDDRITQSRITGIPRWRRSSSSK